jgi:uncharacterized protein (DUF4415 family)
MTDEKIIEVEVTAEDLEKMRAEGVAEKDLPQVGIKRFRPARHIIKTKNVVILDSDVAAYFKKRAKKENQTSYQTQINDELRSVIENQKNKTELRQELLNDEEFLRKLKEKLVA